MDRHELLQRVLGAARPEGLVSPVSVVAAEPKPAICLVEFGADHDEEAVDRIVKDIRDVLEDTELDGVLVIGLVDGLRMTFLDANGRVCNRLLTDGGS